MVSPHLKGKVEPVDVKEKSISQLVSEMAKTAYQGRKLGEAVEVWKEMLKEEDLTIIMGLAGSMGTAGQWKMINWLVEKRFIDVLVSTGANVSEDIVDAMGLGYWQGTINEDDRRLFNAGINRYYDVYGRESDYRKMEDLITEFMLTLKGDAAYSSMEFLYLFGKWLNAKGIKSIAAVASEKKVPIFCPAIMDSAFGEAFLLAANKGKYMTLDEGKGFRQFNTIAERVKDVGVVYIGGGVPKDFTQLLAIGIVLTESPKSEKREGYFREAVRDYYYPHKYAIQITTDSPQWGGLSGCTLEEAVSWGKVHSDGKRVTLYCDATIALPLIAHALNEKVRFERHGTDLSWLFEEVP
jgi:deoxyhypusine synthase